MGIAVIPAAGGGVIRKQTTFTSSGTFTLPAGYGVGQPLVVDIELCGGGGGGGGGALNNTNITVGGGGGGGSGITMLYSNVSLTANATVTVGAAGSGGAAVTGSNNAGNVGTSGGTSDVNSLYYAPGGGYGANGRNGAVNYSGGPINSYGFYIPAGIISGGANGPGGAGGSGGAGAQDQGISSESTNYGGSRGSAGWYGPKAWTDVTQTAQKSTPISNGMGINWIANDWNTGSSASTSFVPGVGGSILSAIQKGGGGGGGASSGTNGTYAGGGAAGTATDGGASGWRDNTAVTGSRNGQNATALGAGGGGGGASPTTSSITGSSGGNGGGGYVTITYWAQEKIMKYLIIKNNVVENVIEADQEFVDAHYPDAVLLNEGEVAGPGWTVENGEYKVPDTSFLLEEVVEEPTE